eukprot:477751-Pyramimonas_sp.AAC.1
MSVRVWVDDINEHVAGSRKAVREKLYQGVLDACRALVAHGLPVSPKSAIVCTNASDSKSVVQRLRRR